MDAQTTLKGWTLSSAIVKGGWNTLKVVAVGYALKFYINGTLVWSGSNTQPYKTGQVGFGFFRNSTAGGLVWDLGQEVSTTPTADLNPFEEVAPGVEVFWWQRPAVPVIFLLKAYRI